MRKVSRSFKKSKTLEGRVTRHDVKTVSGARSSVHRGLWFRDEGPVACVFEHGPTHGRVYLHVLFCDLFLFYLFIGISFDLSLVSLKQTLTAVCVCVWTKKHDWLLIVYTCINVFHNFKFCLNLPIRTETHCCRCTESCFSSCECKCLLTSHVMSWWECIYCISVYFFVIDLTISPFSHLH